MNRDDVLRIAKQAGMAGMASTVVCEIPQLHRFAYLVIEAERKKQRDELLAAIEQTLDENGHLADGENCTLIVLKKALAKAKGGT